jgi:2',3'-cyclic-nucleotide 2'-phosphodiesterase/3'-nucleotidase
MYTYIIKGEHTLKKVMSKKVASAALVMGVIIPQMMPTISYAVEDTNVVKLRILETSDIHVHLADYDYYQTKQDPKVGLARTASLIKQARTEVDNTLLFDNGDAIQGNPLGDYIYKEKKVDDPNYIHPVYRVMNLLDYDAATVGNHEFNYGLDFFAKARDNAEFPIVNANVYIDDKDNNPENDKNYFTPYKIMEKKVKDSNGQEQTIKVGVIGFVPPQVMQWDKAHLQDKVIAKDIVESAKKFVPQMKQEGADVIVVLSHSGMGDPKTYKVGEENVSAYLAQNVPGIDAVLTGHSHDRKAEIINGVAVTMPSSFGSALGVIDLELKQVEGKWTVDKTASKAELRDITAPTAPQTPDQAVLNAIKDEHEGTIAYVNEKVGETTTPINSYFALVQDDPSVQLVTNAQKEYVEKWLKQPENAKYRNIPVLSAGAPFKAGGRNGADYYTDIAAGTLAIKNMADLYVYPNTVNAVLLTGADVKEWLEMSAGQFNQLDVTKAEPQNLINNEFRTYNFDILDGVQYEIDVTQPAKYDTKGKTVNPNANRIKNLTFNGKPVTADQKFIVATNNYRGANAGNPRNEDKFPGVRNAELILQAPDENRQIIVDYIKKKGKIDPAADGNWSFAPIGTDLKVTFQSSPNAQKYLSAAKGVTYIGEDVDGFAKYTLTLTKETPKPSEPPVTPPTTETPRDGSGAAPIVTDPAKPVTAPVTGPKSTGTLPDTATNMFGMLAAGVVAVGAGAFGLLRRRKK